MTKHQAVLLLMGMMFFACGGLKDLESYLKKPRPDKDRPGSASDPDDAADEAHNPEFIYSAAGLIFPVVGKGRRHIISRYGDPRDNGARIHEGIDIAADRGTPVLSVSAGKVVTVREAGNGGKQVWVHDRKRGYTYYYAHLDSQSVEEGDKVVTGTEIGTVGNTGNASRTIPHLHFGVYENDWWNDEAVDPLPLMP